MGGLTVRRGPRAAAPIPPPAPPARFRHLDRYRVDREWNRYEGTAQRELFRTLRERFLARHAADHGWVVDIGSGSGRFTPRLGGPGCRTVAVDLSAEMLRAVPDHWPADLDRPERVRADGRRPPVRSGSTAAVAILGNAVGFAGADALELLGQCADLVAVGGRILIEAAPGPGTTARYLHRLPPGAVRRLLHAPLGAVAPRVLREGFVTRESEDRTRHGFRPLSFRAISARLGTVGFAVAEATAVAPALGAEPDRLEEIRADPVAWGRLLDLEERLGASPLVRDRASALLVAAVRPGPAAEKPAIK